MPRISAVGDVRVFRDEPETLFEHIGDRFQNVDIAFCQSESVYSDKGSEGSSGPRGASPRDLKGYPTFAKAGFNVVSLASNHTMDWGRDALLDCIDRMHADGIQTIGAGPGLDEAREPAIVEHGGTRIAFLGYCSVAPSSYYAVPGRAGVVPMRAITHYEMLENDQPGTPSEIMTWPVERDLEALVADVTKAREHADVVVVSLHWGVHFVRGLIAGYQPVVAHAAIDAGADLILGHHPHILKGIEVYRGAPIFYSLGNFALDTNSGYRPTDQVWRQKLKAAYRLYGSHGPHDYRGTREANFTMIANIDVGRSGLESVSYTPVFMEERVPRVVSTSDPIGKELVEYVRSISEEAGFSTSFRVDGDDVVIETTGSAA